MTAKEMIMGIILIAEIVFMSVVMYRVLKHTQDE